MANAHVNVTKTVDGKQITKPRYHAIPEEAMSTATVTALAKLRAANEAAKAAREAFEALLAADIDGALVDVEGFGSDLPLIPEGFAPLYGYNFGRIAVAAIPSTEKKTKAAATKTAVKFKAKAAPVQAAPATMPEMPATLIRKGKKV
jgi:hypothetical protein